MGRKGSSAAGPPGGWNESGKAEGAAARSWSATAQSPVFLTTRLATASADSRPPPSFAPCLPFDSHNTSHTTSRISQLTAQPTEHRVACSAALALAAILPCGKRSNARTSAGACIDAVHLQACYQYSMTCSALRPLQRTLEITT